MWKLLADVRENHGTTVIVASHDPSLAEHTDRALQLVDGRLVGPADADDRPAVSELA